MKEHTVSVWYGKLQDIIHFVCVKFRAFFSGGTLSSILKDMLPMNDRLFVSSQSCLKFTVKILSCPIDLKLEEQLVFRNLGGLKFCNGQNYKHVLYCDCVNSVIQIYVLMTLCDASWTPKDLVKRGNLFILDKGFFFYVKTLELNIQKGFI